MMYILSMKKYKEKTLVIIAGVAGEIGTAFAKRLIQYNNNNVLGVIRKTPIKDLGANFETVSCELTDEYEIEKKVSRYRY